MGPSLRPGWGHCVVFLGKTLHSHSASLYPSVYMGTGELNAASHAGGIRNTPSRFMLQKPG